MALGKYLIPLLLLSQLFAGDATSAEPKPLNTHIDQAIAETRLADRQQVCSDHEFVRRIYLDLVGRSPNKTEVDQFVSSDSTDRRAELIDALLESPEFIKHFATVLDVMLMERRAGKRIPQAEWIAFLEKALTERWSYDRIVQTIIASDGSGNDRAAAKFILDREVEPNALTRDISRIFLGRDLQCAQCHDHPNITDYEQSEYYQLQAFLTRSYLFEGSADKKPYIGEKAEGESEYQSVFTEDPIARAIPGLLGDLTLDAEPRFDGEQAYAVAPSKTIAGQPKFSRRTELARILTSRNNDQFARNAANRLWAYMMGRGVVHPVDFDHSENPPSDPYLLEVLTDGLQHHEFGIRAFVAEIARSNAYQTSIEIPAESHSDIPKLTARKAEVEQRLAEVKSTLKAATARLKPFQQELAKRRKQLADVDDEITAKNTERENSLKNVAELEKATADLKKKLATAEQKLAEETKKLGEEQKESPVLQKLKTTVDAAKKAVDENASAITSTKTTTAKLLQQIAALKSRRVGLADSVAEARGALIVARQFTQAERPISHFQQHVSYLASAETVALHDQDVTQLVKQLDDGRRVLKDRIATRDQAKATLDDALSTESKLQKLLAERNQAVSDKRKQHADRQSKLTELAAAIQQSQRLAESLEDSQLTDLLASTAKRRNGLQSELTQFESQIDEAQREAEQVKRDLEAATNMKQQAEQALASGNASIAQQESQLASLNEKKAAAEIQKDLSTDQWIALQERRFNIRQLKPLSPEQLAGATISALGLDTLYRSYAESDWKKKNKDVELDPQNSKHQTEVASFFDKRIKQVRDTFISMYAAPAGAPQDVFSSTADQALFLANDGRVQSWLSPANGTLVKRLTDTATNDDLAQHMYLSIHCRPPTESEIHAVAAHLKPREKDRTKAIQEMVWGLISSVEFRFNH